MADDFVQGIVAADIFAKDGQMCLEVKQRRGVQATGSIEHVLVFAQTIGKGADCRGIQPGFYDGRRGRALLVNGFDGAFTANTAARCGIEVALNTGGIEEYVFAQGNRDPVGRLHA